jgi:predicted ArsR family transcriptional regulator
MASPSTRSAILDLIAEFRVAGSQELAGRLALTPAAIRYHLSALLSSGQIQVAPPPRRVARAGRPEVFYCLPPARASNNLPALCLAFLRLRLNPEPISWDNLASQMVDGIEDAPQGMSHRLVKTVACLNGMQYNANWEAGPRGPRLRLRNCPYAAIWEQAPELCALDEAILHRLTGRPWRLVQHINYNASTPSSCLFEITLQSS